jgi:ribosomal protein L16 Arg81 hydroxylase
VYNHRGVYSQVDAGNPDYARFPKYADASIHEVELGPGEVLFLPVGWWHYVQALDVSITITFNNFKFPNEYRWQHPAG